MSSHTYSSTFTANVSYRSKALRPHPTFMVLDALACADAQQAIDIQLSFHRIEMNAHHLAIHSQRAAISSLMAERNAHTSIGYLPPELLSQIFQMLKARHRDDKRLSSSGWLVITHVCRQWRSVALSYSTLWASIDLGRPALTKVMLERSGRAPLHIYGEIPGGLYSRNLFSFGVPFLEDETLGASASTLIARNIGRVRELDLNLNSTKYSDLLCTNSSTPAPILEILRATVSRSSLSFNYPHTTSCRETPSLRVLHLSLSCRDILLPFPTSSVLTELTLEADGRILGLDLLSYLGGTPQLERLNLTGLEFSPDIDRETFVELPNLSMISLDVVACSSASLLGQILYPSDARISFTCRRLDLDDDSSVLESMWPCLLGGCECGCDAPVANRFKVSFTDSCLEVSFGDEATPNLCTVTFSCRSDYDDKCHPFEIYGIVSRALPLANVRYLDVASLSQPTIGEWRAFLTPFKDVEVLRIGYLEFQPFSVLLCTEGLLPSLRRLEVSYCSIGPNVLIGTTPSTTSQSSDSPIRPPLLETITLKYCQYDSDTIAQLSKWVNVECPSLCNIVHRGKAVSEYWPLGNLIGLGNFLSGGTGIV